MTDLPTRIAELLHNDPACNGRVTIDTIERIAGLVPAWQPIETAPKDGTEIVLYDANVKIAAIGYWMNEPKWQRLTGASSVSAAWFPLSLATHWIALPPSPQAAP